MYVHRNDQTNPLIGLLYQKTSAAVRPAGWYRAPNCSALDPHGHITQLIQLFYTSCIRDICLLFDVILLIG